MQSHPVSLEIKVDSPRGNRSDAQDAIDGGWIEVDVRVRKQSFEASNRARAGLESRQHNALKARSTDQVIEQLVAADPQVRESATQSLLEQDDMSNYPYRRANEMGDPRMTLSP